MGAIAESLQKTNLRWLFCIYFTIFYSSAITGKTEKRYDNNSKNCKG